MTIPYLMKTFQLETKRVDLMTPSTLQQLLN